MSGKMSLSETVPEVIQLKTLETSRKHTEIVTRSIFKLTVGILKHIWEWKNRTTNTVSISKRY